MVSYLFYCRAWRVVDRLGNLMGIVISISEIRCLCLASQVCQFVLTLRCWGVGSWKRSLGDMSRVISLAVVLPLARGGGDLELGLGANARERM